MDIWHLFFSIRGRINRKTFWLATLPLAIGYAVADVMVESANASIAKFGYPFMFCLIWPSFAVQTKRWHDRDKSGLWNLIGLVPIVGPIWAFIELGFLKGTAGANSYDSPSFTQSLHNYQARISEMEDASIGSPIRKSEPVTSGSSVSNSWRNS
jgi:uncharacterized membrane protein YhaH (DUF805 family)